MKISQEDAIMQFRLNITICQSSIVHEGCWVNFVTTVGNIDSLQKRIHKMGTILSGNHAVVDRVRCVAVEDLVLSQEDKPKRHQSAR